MAEKEIYKCAECGRVITDKEYLRTVRGNELKFCCSACAYHTWQRGIYEYAKTYNKPKPPAPPAPLKKGYHMTDAERVRILELSENGFDVKKIAAIMQRSQPAVKNVIDNYVLVDADAAESEDADE